jgi:DNA-binding LacI/PurR family transcriptional regulator
LSDEGQQQRVRTLADVARLAGVTTGTASRALANSALVNPVTRERIQTIARAHGFRPNQMARRLRTRASRMIGVVVPLGHERHQHLSDPFFMTMIAALADQLSDRGYDLMLSRVIPDGDDWLGNIVDSGMVDGVLLVGQSNQFDVIERMAADYRPLVAWGAHRAGQRHCSIGSDNQAGGRLAVAHLIARGARRIGFLGDVEAPEFAMRFDGACAATRDAGLDPPMMFQTHLAAEFQERDLLAHLPQIASTCDGVFTATDVIAMRALRLFADAGISVPAEIRIVGYDDLPLANQMVPRLSTVRQDIARGASLMVEALFRRMAGDEVPSVTMPPELIVRDSA